MKLLDFHENMSTEKQMKILMENNITLLNQVKKADKILKYYFDNIYSMATNNIAFKIAYDNLLDINTNVMKMIKDYFLED